MERNFDDFARWLFSQQCQFATAVSDLKTSFPTHLPQFAFVGRSNVGKSSLINALTNRRQLARVSHTPGRTQQINFFDLGGKLHIVDLPGYGFAQVSKTDREAWKRFIDRYLKTSPSLKRVFILVDARHSLKESDAQAMGYINDCGLSFQVVLTKTENKTSLEELTPALKHLLRMLRYGHPEIIETSARLKTGVDVLRRSMAEFIDLSPSE